VLLRNTFCCGFRCGTATSDFHSSLKQQRGHQSRLQKVFPPTFLPCHEAQYKIRVNADAFDAEGFLSKSP
jgi:hypothetical protein